MPSRGGNGSTSLVVLVGTAQENLMQVMMNYDRTRHLYPTWRSCWRSQKHRLPIGSDSVRIERSKGGSINALGLDLPPDLETELAAEAARLGIPLQTLFPSMISLLTEVRRLRGPTMNLSFEPVAVPLFDDGQGGLRITGTRVLLERIVHAFEDGATPEGIVQSYDTLQLADVYAVLSWYLRHKVEVQDYRASGRRKRKRSAERSRPSSPTGPSCGPA